MPILVILFPVSVLGGVMSAMCFEIGRIDARYRLNGSARKLVRGISAALTQGTCDEVRAAFTEALSRVDAVAPVTGESTR